MLKEFKEFALRGNLVDLAIGFVIGAAFTGLVQSLVGDIIMPIIGFVTGGIDSPPTTTSLSPARSPPPIWLTRESRAAFSPMAISSAW